MPDRTVTVRRYAVLLNGRAAGATAGPPTGLVPSLVPGDDAQGLLQPETPGGWSPAHPPAPGVSPWCPELRLPPPAPLSVPSLSFPPAELSPGPRSGG